MTDESKNSDKSSGEKRGVLGTDRAKKLEKTKDADSDEDENNEEDDNAEG